MMLSPSTMTHHLLSAEPEFLSAVLPNPWSISKAFGTSCYTFKRTSEERHDDAGCQIFTVIIGVSSNTQ